MKNADSIKNQEIKRKFVDREIVHCATYLINEMAQKIEYQDELLPVMVGDDWKTPAFDYICEAKHDDIAEIANYFNLEWKEGIGLIDMRENIIDFLNDTEQWQEACDYLRIDPEQTEALEHWIVTKWMAEKLAQHGEMVTEFMDFWIWGRTTSGQAILLDSVITEICEELEILEGQQYEWK